MIELCAQEEEEHVLGRTSLASPAAPDHEVMVSPFNYAWLGCGVGSCAPKSKDASKKGSSR